ncbi:MULTISPECIES: glycoside hydrolase family 28 protein [Lactobacillaceae]|uniref:glycoside hydrolase family 28 protein n=1 Tax=Lactobacillaceae TaxID=33958 RepID=UPI001E331AA0|nr:glycosyl hydrolase family 28 protein [Lactobacillus sp. HBUAS51381]
MMIQSNERVKLKVAPASLTATSCDLVWRQFAEPMKSYTVFQDGVELTKVGSEHTYYHADNLNPEQIYNFDIQAQSADDKLDQVLRVTVKTLRQHDCLNVCLPPYNADGTGHQIETNRIQQAINDCEPGGTVLIPAKSIVCSGALDLKSEITLEVDGRLQGSHDPNDYIYTKTISANGTRRCNSDGLVLTRYEGWELYCYRSLLNIGYLDPDNRDRKTCQNVRVCGTGQIRGGGTELGDAMEKIYSDPQAYPKYVSDGIPGRRVRGRLVNAIQVSDLQLTGVSFENPPCWTLHLLYCDAVTVNNIGISSQGIDNGDGIDPDSSQNVWIFANTFDTGDDCIAIKSGKNPEGNRINRPSRNIEIFDLKMTGGHGLAIGSEQSGGSRER